MRREFFLRAMERAVQTRDAKLLTDLIVKTVSETTEGEKALVESVKLAKDVVDILSMRGVENRNEAATALSSSTSGDDSTLVSLSNVQVLQPKGRFEVKLGLRTLKLVGKQVSVELDWSNVAYVLSIPRKDAYMKKIANNWIVVVTEKPVPVRKKTQTVFVIQIDAKTNMPVETTVARNCWPGGESVCPLPAIINAPPLECWETLLTTLSGRSISRPDMFRATNSDTGVKCYHGTNDGVLFPFLQGFLFAKPFVFIPRHRVGSVTLGRGGSATTRTVDVVVEVEGESTPTEFKMVSRDELGLLTNFVQSKQFQKKYLTPPPKLCLPVDGGAASSSTSASTAAAASAPVPAESASSSSSSSSAAAAAAAAREAPPPSRAAAVAAAACDSKLDSDSDSEGDDDYEPSAEDSSYGSDGDSSSEEGGGGEGGGGEEEEEEEEEERVGGGDEDEGEGGGGGRSGSGS